MLASTSSLFHYQLEATSYIIFPRTAAKQQCSEFLSAALIFAGRSKIAALSLFPRDSLLVDPSPAPGRKSRRRVFFSPLGRGVMKGGGGDGGAGCIASRAFSIPLPA